MSVESAMTFDTKKKKKNLDFVNEVFVGWMKATAQLIWQNEVGDGEKGVVGGVELGLEREPFYWCIQFYIWSLTGFDELFSNL